MEQHVESGVAEMVREGTDSNLAAVNTLAETKAAGEHVDV